MCSFKGRHHRGQYMPGKPHKYEFTFFPLCGMSGNAYNFEIYTASKCYGSLPSELDLWTSSNDVVRLSLIVPEKENHKIYFDNYYTSLRLHIFLKSKGIFSLGTVRSGLVLNSQFLVLKTVSKINSLLWGSIYEYVTKVIRVEISSLMWVDNKCVSLLSTYAGTNLVSSVKRRDTARQKTWQK